MFAIPRHYGIPDITVTQSDVYVNGNSSDTFKVTTGVLQCDVLAPFMFVIVVDYILSDALKDVES